MKLQTTKKQILQNFGTVISIGYCDAQYLTYYLSPFAYSSGVYGWACDYYQIGNKCLSTGYSPIGQKIDYKLLRQAETKAQKIVNDSKIKYETKNKKLNTLLTNLLNTI